MDRRDSGVSSEVLDIECEQMSDGVCLHYRHDPRVMYLPAAHSSNGYQMQPTREDFGQLVEQREAIDEISDCALRTRNIPAKTVRCERARRDGPKLDENLRREEEVVSSDEQSGNRDERDRMRRSRAIDEAYQNIRIQEIRDFQS
jgi:hypothetical protein